MRILEIIPQLSSGGAERFTVDLCNELANSNEVILLTFYSLDKYGFYVSELSDNIKLICLNKQNGASFGTFIKVLKFIRNSNPDVVHMHLRSILYCLPAIFFLRYIKYFMTIHSDADKEADGLWGKLVRKLCFKSRLVTPVTISPKSQQTFNEYYKLISSKMIFNGRDVYRDKVLVSNSTRAEVASYKQSPADRVIINLARINEVKRQTLLTRVASRLYREGYLFTLLIVGNMRDKKMVKEIESYQCPLVHMLGEKSNPLEYLKLSDAYCLCSSYEGMPISLIEALGMQTIPICTPVGGIVDVVSDGYNGILADGLSEDDLYYAIKRFLELTDETMYELKKHAIETYPQYSMVECAQNYLSLFNSI